MPPIAGSLTLALKAIRETNILYTNIYVCMSVWGGGGEERWEWRGGEVTTGVEGGGEGVVVFVCSSSLSPYTVHSH